jgi:hypothetical protein
MCATVEHLFDPRKGPPGSERAWQRDTPFEHMFDGRPAPD